MLRLYADSTNDLSSAQIIANNIKIVPLYVTLGNKTGKDGIDIRPDDIYKWADENNDTPKTAAFSPADIMSEIEDCKANGDDMIFIGISEYMSVTCNVVRVAAEELEYEDHVYVVNSKNLSTGIGLLLIEAADMIREGMSAPEVVDRLNEIIPQVRSSFVVDTLTYLQRGGRCNAVTALLANTLKLKPKIVVEDGKMDVSKKYRGNMSQVALRYAMDMKDELLKARSKYVFITHSGVEADIVNRVTSYLKNLGRFKNVCVTRAGGVISSHCGPGTLGVLFIKEND